MRCSPAGRTTGDLSGQSAARDAEGISAYDVWLVFHCNRGQFGHQSVGNDGRCTGHSAAGLWGRKVSGGRADADHVCRPFGMRRRFDHGRRIPRFADQIGPAGGLDAGIDLGDAVQSIMVESDAVT